MSKKSQTTALPKAKKPAPPAARAAQPQTTGGTAARSSGAPPTGSARPSNIRPPRLIRETHTKAEREAEIQRLLLLITGVVLGITALVLVIALVYDQLVVPNQTVAVVNDEAITVSEFERRVRIERFLISSQLNAVINQYRSFGFDDATINQQLLSQPPYSTFVNELNIPDQLGNRVINTMVEDEIVRQALAERGITITRDDVQAQINEFFGYDPQAALFTPTPTLTPTVSPTPFVSPTPSPTPTETPLPTATATAEGTPAPTATEFPTATPTNTPDATQRADEFNTTRTDYYSAVRSDASVGDADIDAYFETLALREALQEALTADTTRITPFYDARHILVATEEEANNVLAALNAGESFAALAAAVSQDEGNKAQGGELGWAPASNYVDPFADALTSAEIGALVGPVETEFGWHVIQVRAREERELSEQDFEQLQNRALTDYIEQTRETAGDSIVINDIWIDFVPR